MSRRRARIAAWEGRDVRHRAGAIALASTAVTLLLVVATAALFTVDGAIGGDPVSNVLALVAVTCYAVVGGLIAAPIVAVPTSVGYGASFEGLAALLAMLNSCAAGLAVVNIDNGFGAGHLACTILRSAARLAREKSR